MWAGKGKSLGTGERARYTGREKNMVKHLPTMQGTLVRSLGREDPLEKGMAIHSSVLA